MTNRIRQLMAVLVAISTVIPLRSVLAEPLRIYAAGSLTSAITDMVKAFPAARAMSRHRYLVPPGCCAKGSSAAITLMFSRPPTWTSRAGWHARIADRRW